MTPLQRYIAEENVTDHLDGLLSRREAVRRLALLGVGTAAAGALIAACAQNRPDTAAPPNSPAPSGRVLPPGMDRAVPTSEVTWAGPGGQLRGAWAPAANARGAVLVVHENKGLTDWVRSVAARLAGAGYASLAVDLLSSQGGTAAFADPAAATAALGALAPDAMIADLNAGLTEVARRAPGTKTAVVGFCMGGGLVWQLLASGAPGLAAAFPFYGPAPEQPDFSASAAVAVLGFYGALDQRVNATEPAARAALAKAGLVHELVTEPGANHAFFNDTGERYDQTAAEDAWRRMLSWLGSHVG